MVNIIHAKFMVLNFPEYFPMPFIESLSVKADRKQPFYNAIERHSSKCEILKGFRHRKIIFEIRLQKDLLIFSYSKFFYPT